MSNVSDTDNRTCISYLYIMENDNLKRSKDSGISIDNFSCTLHNILISFRVLDFYIKSFKLAVINFNRVH